MQHQIRPDLQVEMVLKEYRGLVETQDLQAQYFLQVTNLFYITLLYTIGGDNCGLILIIKLNGFFFFCMSLLIFSHLDYLHV